MPPHVGPGLLLRPASYRNRANLDARATSGDAISELVIIRQIIQQSFESTDLLKSIPGRRHRRAEREIHPLEHVSLANLTPKIRINGDSFQGHRKVRPI